MHPRYRSSLTRRWSRAKASTGSGRSRQGALLTSAAALLSDARSQLTRLPAGTLPEHAFDSLLLDLSPLYRRSRALYRKAGGSFHATLVTSPRTLSSPILLEPRIEYTPLETELRWAATDPRQRRDPAHLLRLRTYVASLFHEQNHRLLWQLLPPPPRGRDGVRRYLNFAESLVIATDMALGDELAPLSEPFYLCGAIYDPGTGARAAPALRARRQYRNYLQAAAHATYLMLELYDPRRIPRGVEALFPGLGEWATAAAERAARLDERFIARTNLAWQRQHGARAGRILRSRARGPELRLPTSPMDHRLQYLWAEKWLERIGL
jgi:hypothetical protein